MFFRYFPLKLSPSVTQKWLRIQSIRQLQLFTFYNYLLKLQVKVSLFSQFIYSPTFFCSLYKKPKKSKGVLTYGSSRILHIYREAKHDGIWIFFLAKLFNTTLYILEGFMAEMSPKFYQPFNCWHTKVITGHVLGHCKQVCQIVLTFSLPAKSTRYSLPWSFFSLSTFSCLTWIRNTLWLRELCSFISVIKSKFLQNWDDTGSQKH